MTKEICKDYWTSVTFQELLLKHEVKLLAPKASEASYIDNYNGDNDFWEKGDNKNYDYHKCALDDNQEDDKDDKDGDDEHNYIYKQDNDNDGDDGDDDNNDN